MPVIAHKAVAGFILPERRRDRVAKGKYERWLEPDGLVLLEGWARDGLTNEQIAHNMGVSLTSIKKYIAEIPAISTALKKGKEVADYEVENALFKRAVGYRYDEITYEDVDGEMMETKKVTKEVVPDVTAQIYWLKNRKPKKWRDRPPEEVNREALAKAKEILGGVDSAF